ncbi:Uncharacterized protein SCF082_LOCUS40198 [Durusdinium trenchii]|uniref:Rhodanese domain-containing protein n=1 Tax=Durusdinium trenchii TaxID=1381693 RepID=A0ABP0PME7_9DINO
MVTEHERQTQPMTMRNRVRWALVLLFQGAIFAGWWWISPKGFPVGHSHFWANSALPVLGLLVVIGAAIGLVRETRLPRDELLVTVPGLWIGAAVMAAILFSQSLLKLLLVAVPVLFGFTALAWISLRWTWRVVSVLVVSIIVGGFLAFSQQGPPATTVAHAVEMPPVPKSGLSASSRYELGRASFIAPAATIYLPLENAGVEIDPLLSFESRSPDRFWTIFARQQDRVGPQRRLLGVLDVAETLTAFYQTDFESRLVLREENDRSYLLEATAVLPEAIYSHLNRYCHLWLSTSEDVSIVFSPCPEAPIDILPVDYPLGRPARVAFLNEGGFHVVEARSGEKGPFKELASGSLKRGDPLALTFVVAGRPSLRCELLDWSTQASFDLSPTAGWGLPMNAIEFSRNEAGCGIWITLAATSVGRGWDSVGHSSGGYRNRIHVELLDHSSGDR